MSIDDRFDDEHLDAAEYVLGLLDAQDRRAAETRMRNDEAFAAEVGRWEARFAPWLQAVPPVDVPAAVWDRIQTLLWAHALPHRSAVSPAPLTLAWQRLSLWRGLAIGGLVTTCASLALVVFLLRHPSVPPSRPPVVVTRVPVRATPMAVALRNDDGSVAYTATLDGNDVLVLTPVRNAADTRAPELWLIPPGDRPHSLGMVQRDRPMAIRIPVALRAAARDGLFAVSMEPPGSGPHVAPTGPVVAKGGMVEL